MAHLLPTEDRIKMRSVVIYANDMEDISCKTPSRPTVLSRILGLLQMELEMGLLTMLAAQSL